MTPTPASGDRLRGALLLGAAAFVPIVMTVAFPFARVGDDSLFYVVVARNLSDGRGLTFNGLQSTNGFQPLWQLIVTIVVGACDLIGVTAPQAQLRVVILLCWLLLGLAMFLLDRLLVDLKASGPARLAAAAILLVFFGGSLALMASEAYLAAVLLVVAMGTTRRRVDAPGMDLRHAALFGVSLGLLILARLDTVFVVVSMLVAVTLTRRRGARTWLPDSVATLAGIWAVVVPYLAWNLMVFGHVVPISGSLKVNLSQPHLALESVERSGWVLLAGSLALFAYGVVRRPARPALDLLTVTMIVGSALPAAFYFTWGQRQQTAWAWYEVPYVFAFTLSAVGAVDLFLTRSPPMTRRTRSMVVRGATVGLIALPLVVAVRIPDSDAQRHASRTIEFARSLSHIVPDAGAIAAVDRPGILAVSGARDILAMDGLTANYGFQDRLNRRGVACALEELGVHHLLDWSEGPLQRFAPDGSMTRRFESWLTNADVGALRFTPAQRVATGGSPSMTLWRLDADACPQ